MTGGARSTDATRHGRAGAGVIGRTDAAASGGVPGGPGSC